MEDGTKPVPANDPIAEVIDEMADLCALWKKHKEVGHRSEGIQLAILHLAGQCVSLQEAQSHEQIALKALPAGLASNASHPFNQCLPFNPMKAYEDGFKRNGF